MQSANLPSLSRCKGPGDGGQVFGDIVDRLALTQLVPVVHRRDPRARGAGCRRQHPRVGEGSAEAIVAPIREDGRRAVNRNRCAGWKSPSRASYGPAGYETGGVWVGCGAVGTEVGVFLVRASPSVS